MFSDPASARLGDRWTAVRILGGSDLDAEGRAFMERHGVSAYPTLLAVTAGGTVVDRDLTGQRFPTVDALVAAMEAAERRQDAYVEEREGLRHRDDAAGRMALAALYRSHGDLDAARTVYERMLEDGADLAAHEALLDVVEAQGDRDAVRRTLDRMIRTFPAAPARLDWRLRRAAASPAGGPGDHRAVLGARRDAFVALLGDLEQEGAPAADQALVRVRLADLAGRLGDDAERDRHAAWIREHAPESRAALELDLVLARAAVARGDVAAAERHALAVAGRGTAGEPAASAHMLLAELASGRGDRAAVREHLEAVTRLAPGTALAATAARILRSLR